MGGFNFTRDAELEGAVLIAPFSMEDERGAFVKYYEKDIYREGGLDFPVREVFISTSGRGVIRGLHFQTENPQAKLVTVLAGSIYDVIVDLRKASATYGKWKGFELSAKNRRVLYVPKGFAHGFLSLDDGSVVMYKCDAPYSKETDGGIVWNDLDIGITWPGGYDPIVSHKDAALMKFAEFKGFNIL